MTPQRYHTLLTVLNNRQPDLTVVADEVHKGRNLSAIIRTCDSVGIDKIHMVTPKMGYRDYRGTASGSNKWVEVETHADICQPLATLKQLGYQVVAAGLGANSVNYRDVDYTKPTALVLGAEKNGLSAEAKGFCDQLIQIPMIGMVESLNVSVATAIILQEALLQRNKAGIISTRRLPEEHRVRRFFQWAHPKVAEFCDNNRIPYPPVSSEDGEIINASTWYQSVREHR